MPLSRTTGLLLLLGCLAAGSAAASDILKEQRWASQLSDQLVVGETVWLKVGGREVFGIYTPATTPERRGGVILLHGMGAHPDWPDVIAPLRRELPDAGWSTLSIQMPILDGEADLARYLPLFPEAYERIAAAITYLQGQGIHNIVLVGHSLGAAMGAAYLAGGSPKSRAVRAFVGIGMNQYPDPEAPAHTPGTVAKLTIPVLDIYGALDSAGVREAAARRRQAAAEAGNKRFRQLEIPGADHFFHDLDMTLVNRVSGWLRHVAPAAELKLQ
jgi:dienelactone hydrolase